MWTIFNVFIDFATILLLIYAVNFFFFWSRGMRNLTSLTSDHTLQILLLFYAGFFFFFR